MNKKSKFLILTVLLTVFTILLQIIYLQNTKALSKKDIEEKNILVKALGLPDLAISTEAMFIRHRTLTSTYNIFKESPELREYFPTTFTYSHSHILNNTPSKVLNEK